MSIDSDTASVQILPFDLNEEPPLYTQDRDADIDINADTHMLDSRLLKEHDYHLVRNGKQWLSLSLKDRVRTGDELPHFTQGSTLSGSVKLVLGPKGAVIRSVSVSIIGELTSPVYYSRFLTMTRQLYVSDVNDLDASLPDPPEVSEGKLDGEHSWPFAIRLPKGIRIVLSDKEGHNFLLPPTLSKHASKVQVKYKLVARVKKGILSSDNRLEAEFDYTPRFRPSQPSILRQIATMENQPLVGPDEDPAGWKVLDPIVLRGKVFNVRSVETTCVLSIARPLCFARGTTIPLMLSITCSDAQALDLLASPSSPNVQLICYASFSLHINTNVIRVVGPGDTRPEMLGTATWRPAHKDGENDSQTRMLYGEVMVPVDAAPSARIVNFMLQYAITLFDFKAATFTPVDAEAAKGLHVGLQSELVQVVTTPARGPVATSSLPPLYDAISA